MIRFDQVGKRFPGGIAALADLTFTVESGEMVILSGHSLRGTPWTWRTKARFSSTVISERRRWSWKTMPILRRW